MATTTNYGWTTPDDTGLVKDGASAIRTLGSAVDSTLKTQIDAQIAKSIVDAKGDIIAATADNTVSRLASSGVNNDVLTVDTTTATGLKWATPAQGGMTLISTTTLSGASITLSSIPQTYNSLYLIVRNFLPATDGSGLNMRYNSDTNTRYKTSNGNNAASQVFGSSFLNVGTQASDNTVTGGIHEIFIPDYANTATWKMNTSNAITVDSTTTTNFGIERLIGAYNQTSAISSITFFPSSGNFTSGSVLLYGVK